MTNRNALKLFILVIGIAGGILLTLDKQGSAQFGQIGVFLLYLVCALLVLDYIFYGYYRRKRGVEGYR